MPAPAWANPTPAVRYGARGAQHADMDSQLAALPSATGGRHPLPRPEDFANQLRDWGITPDHRVVVYDDTGGRMAAARAW